MNTIMITSFFASFVIIFTAVFTEDYTDPELELSEPRASTVCASPRLSSVEIAFVRLATYRGEDDNGIEYQKTYYLARNYLATWVEAKPFCKAFDMELVSFESISEVQQFISMCKSSKLISVAPRAWYLTDGMTIAPKTKDGWYWVSSGRNISFPIPWTRGQPDFYGNNEYCLSIGKTNSTDTFGFNDFPCSKSSVSFICQKFDFYLS